MNTRSTSRESPSSSRPPTPNTFSLSGMDYLFMNNFIVEASAKKKIAETVFHLRHDGDSTQMVS